MIETRKQYEEIKLNLYFFGDDELAAHRRAWLLETIEALREVARAAVREHPNAPMRHYPCKLCDAVEKLPAWLVEE